MPLRTPSNYLTDRDVHNLVELWEDIICFIPKINQWVDDNFTWIPTPGKFQKLIKEFRERQYGLNEQKRVAQEILDARPKTKASNRSYWTNWPAWKNIVDWLNSIHPVSTGSKETDPIRQDLNVLRAVFELGSPTNNSKL